MEKAVNRYKKDCFAFKDKKGICVCTALTKMECEKCSFYKDKTTYLKELIKCEEHNRKTGATEKYGKFRPFEFEVGGASGGSTTSI